MLPGPTRLEGMTADEMQALDLASLGFALNELAVALAACGTLAIEARRALRDVIIAKREYADSEDYKAALEVAKCNRDEVKLRIGTLKELKSTLQTIVRAIP